LRIGGVPRRSFGFFASARIVVTARASGMRTLGRAIAQVDRRGVEDLEASA
jgi:hypothetical protein